MGKVPDDASKASSSSSPPLPSAASSSTSIADTINGSQHFQINGYSLSKGIGIGKYKASDTFTVGGYQWAIYFYPDGKSVEDNAEYVSLFIALASEGSDVRALFELTLLDQSGKERHKVHSHFGRTLESGPCTLKYRGSMWGYQRFFMRSLLETSDYLKNDTISVHCIVGVVRSHTEGPKIFSIPVPPSSIGQDFGKLLESGKGADVNFEVDGEVFPAHKLEPSVFKVPSMEKHPIHFGFPREIDYESTFFPIPGTTQTRELLVTTIWVDKGLLHLVPYRYKAWLINECNGAREGLLQDFNGPLLETEDGGMEDPKPESEESGV
ncbi:hypothetical protein ACJRO7_009025 [Eucalyptus globulus]|uniref:MATH domain-containing protein n=1 Tax=Eucalyptus globulus TaxID=34317 RepID=A0ABD3IU92_EUCGL